MPANIGGAITPKNAKNRSRPWLARYARNHVTKTKMLITIWTRPDTTFNPTKKSVRLAIRKKANPVTAEIAIHRRLLFIGSLLYKLHSFSAMECNMIAFSVRENCHKAIFADT